MHLWYLVKPKRGGPYRGGGNVYRVSCKNRGRGAVKLGANALGRHPIYSLKLIQCFKLCLQQSSCV